MLSRECVSESRLAKGVTSVPCEDLNGIKLTYTAIMILIVAIKHIYQERLPSSQIWMPSSGKHHEWEHRRTASTFITRDSRTDGSA